jgi:ATP-dependent helicase HrpB
MSSMNGRFTPTLLALALHSQALVRPDLRIMVMSATLDGAAVADLLGGAPVIAAEGRMFPVEIRYLPPREGQRLEAPVVSAVEAALAATDGDILVFLPGQGEIARCNAALTGLGATIDIMPLYGNLSFADQDRAIAPSPAGRRKVVLSTSIAETSLTIEGVRAVVDAGLARIPRFSPRTGMTRLTTVRVSRAAAEQRAGRAGRVAAGICYRLWHAEEHAHLRPFATPEILEADLAPLALDLAVAGITDPQDLRWLTPPPRGPWRQAVDLLTWLEAVDDHGHATDHGRALGALGAHPRLAHMMLRSRAAGDGALASDIAAIVEERDILRSDGPEHDADLRLRADLLRAVRSRERLPDQVAGMRVMRDAVGRVIDSARAWRRELGIESSDEWDDASAAGRVLALAFPDRVAQRRPGALPRYQLRNGTGSMLTDSPALASEAYLVIAETDGKMPESRIFLAAPLTLDELRVDFGAQITTESLLEWDAHQGLRAVEREVLGALVLRERRTTAPDPDAVGRVLLEAIGASKLALLRWSEGSQRLRERLAFVHHWDSSWPDVSDPALIADADRWLGPHLNAVRTRGELERLDLGALLLDRLDWHKRSLLDELAPTHFTAPTGSRLPIDYSEPTAPVVRVRLQEMFGQVTTPRVMGGRVPLTMHLLSPAHRPVQVTQDLESFWKSSYFDVRKDMKGRYPKHPWPEDPIAATPTRRRK